MRTVRELFRGAAVCCIALACSACLGPKNAAVVQDMGVKFEWAGSGCALSSPNPELRLSNVPQGTAFLKVTMTDLDVPTFNHGGGTVAYDGSGVVPAGALKAYSGPCPPSGSHTYEFRVVALDAQKEFILGKGTAAKRYP